jgi:rhodanese-related sulfurtransferase
MSDAVANVLGVAQERAAKHSLSYFGAVTPAEAHTLLANLPNARLIDVRTRAEWDFVGHVPDSILIEWTSYPAGERNPAFLGELRGVTDDPDTPLLFLCRSGQRSDSAARAAAAAGYKQAFNVLEGFEGARDNEGHRSSVGGWRKAGLPWVQG